MDSISVVIRFFRNDLNEEEIMTLDAHDYFDDDECEFEIDSIPKYNHAIEYIPDNKNVKKVTLELCDTCNRRKKKVETYYWANRDIELIILSEYKDNSLTYSEAIHQVRLPKITRQENDLYSIGRFSIDNNELICTYYALIEESGPSEEEYRLV